MVWKGLSQSEAALLLSVYAFLGMALTLILGWVADKANKPRLTALILFAAAGAMFLPIMKPRNPAVEKVKAAELIDDSILKKLDQAGFVDEILQKYGVK